MKISLLLQAAKYNRGIAAARSTRASSSIKSSRPLKSPEPPFRRDGKSFDELFVDSEKPKKAWDGQNKDNFFRDKYAHVHAKQKAQHKREKEEKQERLSKKAQSMTYRNDQIKSHQPELELTYTERHKLLLSQNPNMEFTYGTNATKHILAHRKVKQIFTSFRGPGDIDPEILRACSDAEIPIRYKEPTKRLDIMAGNGVHNGYVCQTEKLNIPTLDSGPSFLNECKTGLYLDQITDPHNLGAIMRTAKWYECDVVGYSPKNSASVSPAAVKASSGATEHLHLGKVFSPLNFFDLLKEKGWTIVSTVAPNTHVSIPKIDPDALSELKSQGPIMLVLGNEGEGVRTSLTQRSTYATTLSSPQTDIDSLNVSIAASILLEKLNR